MDALNLREVGCVENSLSLFYNRERPETPNMLYIFTTAVGIVTMAEKNNKRSKGLELISL